VIIAIRPSNRILVAPPWQFVSAETIEADRLCHATQSPPPPLNFVTRRTVLHHAAAAPR